MILRMSRFTVVGRKEGRGGWWQDMVRRMAYGSGCMHLPLRSMGVISGEAHWDHGKSEILWVDDSGQD